MLVAHSENPLNSLYPAVHFRLRLRVTALRDAIAPALQRPREMEMGTALGNVISAGNVFGDPKRFNTEHFDCGS